MTFRVADRVVRASSASFIWAGALVAGLVIAGCSGDEPASAVVDGRSYAVGPVSGITVSEDELIPHGRIEQTNTPASFLDGEVYSIENVDPTTLLLARVSLGRREHPDDFWGPYVGLWGDGQDPDACRYFDQPALTFCQ